MINKNRQGAGEKKDIADLIWNPDNDKKNRYHIIVSIGEGAINCLKENLDGYKIQSFDIKMPLKFEWEPPRTLTFTDKGVK